MSNNHNSILTLFSCVHAVKLKTAVIGVCEFMKAILLGANALMKLRVLSNRQQ